MRERSGNAFSFQPNEKVVYLRWHSKIQETHERQGIICSEIKVSPLVTEFYVLLCGYTNVQNKIDKLVEWVAKLTHSTYTKCFDCSKCYPLCALSSTECYLNGAQQDGVIKIKTKPMEIQNFANQVETSWNLALLLSYLAMFQNYLETSVKVTYWVKVIINSSSWGKQPSHFCKVRSRKRKSSCVNARGIPPAA